MNIFNLLLQVATAICYRKLTSSNFGILENNKHFFKRKFQILKKNSILFRNTGKKHFHFFLSFQK